MIWQGETGLVFACGDKSISKHDEKELAAFARFLSHVNGPDCWPRTPEPIPGCSIRARPDADWITVPEEWRPYAMGKGPAPDPLT